MVYFFARLCGDKYTRRMRKVKRFYNNPRVEETYALDMAFVEFMVPRLELYKEKASQYIVYDFTIIDKILEGFKLYLELYDWEIKDIEVNYKKFHDSMQLFAEHCAEFSW